ncbi:hypothetical protein AABD40_01055 [Staphylococcus shinii]|uniref:hypothetical protein n=1 Tax=Staphylococcus shinii TaxID=2912228 RepID=UPI00298F2A85|nr:hypothetical protein [Staphylococcus shinii]MDW8569965.1 hypothetical protein [Staphylococcus shinii]MDW8574132.1 hypothetical protein [Staphylococcus shinii]
MFKKISLFFTSVIIMLLAVIPQNANAQTQNNNPTMNTWNYGKEDRSAVFGTPILGAENQPEPKVPPENEGIPQVNSTTPDDNAQVATRAELTYLGANTGYIKDIKNLVEYLEKYDIPKDKWKDLKYINVDLNIGNLSYTDNETKVKTSFIVIGNNIFFVHRERVN